LESKLVEEAPNRLRVSAQWATDPRAILGLEGTKPEEKAKVLCVGKN
jgi:hypothetical protein